MASPSTSGCPDRFDYGAAGTWTQAPIEPRDASAVAVLLLPAAGTYRVGVTWSGYCSVPVLLEQLKLE